MPISPLQRKLAAYSRNRHFLIRAVLVILAVCIVGGFVVAKFAKSEETDASHQERLVRSVISYNSTRDREEFGDLLLKRGKPTPEALAHYITFTNAFLVNNLMLRGTRNAEEIREMVPPLELSRLAIEEHIDLESPDLFLFNAYAEALYEIGEKKEEAIRFLTVQAEAEKPVRFANQFLGQALSQISSRREESLGYFAREAEFFERSDFSRFRQLDINLQLNNDDAVLTLLKDNSYRSLLSSRFAMEIGARTQNSGLIISGSYRYILEEIQSRIFPLALFASMVWFIILSKLGGVERLRSKRLPLYALGVIAGFASVVITHFFIIWQERIFGFTQNGEFVNDLLYCISGIGLREETAKILAFLPLVPFIAKSRTQIEILITAACVGIGFATIENVGYFAIPGGISAAFPRLVTAAFAHASLTGILGLALCRFWHWPKRCWEELVGTFVGVVVVHGIYDALIMVHPLNDQLGILNIVVFALLVRYFFHKIVETRGSHTQIISPLGVFVIGATLVVGVSWIYAMRHFSFDTAMDGVGKGALQAAVLAFIYINELRDE